MDSKEVGARIKELRMQRKMNRNELANRAGVSPTYIYQLEKGEKSPTVEYLGYICWALGISLSDFFTSGDEVNLVGGENTVENLTEKQKDLLNQFLKSL